MKICGVFVFLGGCAPRARHCREVDSHLKRNSWLKRIELFVGDLRQIGLSGQEAPHPADGVSDAA
jgi:hypothetical protein